MRVVVDTNVIVSATLSPTGTPARVIGQLREARFELLASQPILAEYPRALGYQRVRARHGMSDQEIEQLVGELRQFAVIVEPETALDVVRDDPADNRFLECAATGGADYIVSGDSHLLSLRDYSAIQILTPAVFLAVLEEGARGAAP